MQILDNQVPSWGIPKYIHKKKSQYKMKIRFVDNEKDVHYLKDNNSRAVFNIMNKNVQTKQFVHMI